MTGNRPPSDRPLADLVAPRREGKGPLRSPSTRSSLRALDTLAMELGRLAAAQDHAIAVRDKLIPDDLHSSRVRD